MKTQNIILPDWVFDKALELAKSHGVTTQAYLSTLLVEYLSAEFGQPRASVIQLPKNPIGDVSAPATISEAFVGARDTLKQVLMVCAHVYENGDVPKDDVQCAALYRLAVRRVASELRIKETTVRDKCTTDRRLGPADTPINQAKFIYWLRNPASLREHLCQKFLEFRTEIRSQFSKWLPSLPGQFGQPTTPSQTTVER
jgi:hypothetical protein